MFKFLALETSTEMGSLALLDGPRLLSATSFGGGITHTERLLPALDFILRQSRTALSELRGLAVGLGPGSFTGLRIGMSVALGLSWSRRLPLAGVSSLAALALAPAFPAGEVCTLLDARKGEVYWALYRVESGRLDPLLPERVSALSAVLSAVSPAALFVGTGAERYREALSAWGGSGIRLAGPALAFPRAENVGLLAWERLSRGEADDLSALAPHYLRRSEAELARPELKPEDLFLERRLT